MLSLLITENVYIYIFIFSVFFESLSYEVDHETGLIDYDDLRKRAKLFQPKLIIAGGSAYPREINYGLMREVMISCNPFTYYVFCYW